MSQSSPRKAVVLVSGGMDSAVTIAIAREQGYQVHALSVAYGQRHNAELAASERVSRMHKHEFKPMAVLDFIAAE